MARKKRAPGEPVTIKKYANRRLYNTETSSYVTLDHLAAMIRDGDDFIVLDAKTSDDLTRAVLTQIIFERETKDDNMLPIEFLRQLIRFYGDSMQAMVPAYLQGTLEVLNRHQDQIREAFGDIDHGKFMPMFEEMTRQNMAFFDQTMQAFARAGQQTKKTENPEQQATKSAPSSGDDEINALREQLAELKEKVDQLSG
ncbi:MAG: polyhydroxyalkanoate synthesis repressor PhaR [Kordiimonas sp.]